MTSEEASVNDTDSAKYEQNGSVAQNFGLELWDQYEELVRYTDQGVEYIKKYAQFAKERIELENSECSFCILMLQPVVRDIIRINLIQ